MKYIILCLIAMLVCFGVGFVAAHLLKKKITKRPLRIFVAFLVSIALMFAVVIIYCLDYYHADEAAINALNGNDMVTVTKIKGGYYFDGPGNMDRALIFYPGAKVEAESYSQLMLEIAQGGEDCFLATMPLNFALFNMNAADSFIENYNYKNWDIAGHSMGGMVAAMYANSNLDKIDSVIFLAAYPSKPMDSSLTALSIYGDCDNCLDKSAYEDARKNFPTQFEEYIINGGNHSQMGNYGHQSGDGEATVSKEVQWSKIAEIINNYH